MRSVKNAGTNTSQAPAQSVPREAGWGFTLVKLLVVIGVIPILAVLLLPALSAGRAKARGIGCRNNLRQVQLASAMYAHDNRGLLLPNIQSTDQCPRRPGPDVAYPKNAILLLAVING